MSSLLVHRDVIYVGLDSGVIQAINTSSWGRMLKGHTSIVYGMLMLGDSLLSGSWDRTIRVWNIATGECKRTVDTGSRVLSLAKCGGEKVKQRRCIITTYD